ncbi:MAG TPA: DUF993 family protein [Streptosporangiaceae bacterium]|nr:DUF993 family protein [Streptosporangiaceae bacterium]
MTDSAQISLPGSTEPLTLTRPEWATSYPPPATRRVYAAAHVAARRGGEIDWDATLAFRDYLWTHGFAVAEAMDTAQRGMGLSWPQARELIQRSAARAAQRREQNSAADIACGAGTDQLDNGPHTLAEITSAYEEQLAVVQDAGAEVILMASRALAASARSAGDYLDVYGHLLSQARRPVILHWLGDAFDPALRGYWGSPDFAGAAKTVLQLIDRADGQVSGVKLSLLNADHELTLRRQLPPGVRMYTGDDFNYADLIRGDGDGHSDALLGAFAAITAPAAAALHALDAGDLAGYDAAIGPTVALSRLIFTEPTYHYKVGVAFLAWLNGLQPEFAMVGGLEASRSRGHLIQAFQQAAVAGALRDPELAVDRMTQFLRAAT